MPDFEEYCNEIRELWDSRWLTNAGVKHQQFGQQLEEYLNIPNVTLYTNGHLALEEAIASLDLPRGAEVITTPFTFVSTTNAILRNGLVPVFCDVNDWDYTMDVAKIEALISEKTAAILPVHVYGNLCAVDEIQQIAKKHGLKVIYDAAHAFGITKNGVSAACYGDISMFSFHATKVFQTIEGGALCYLDDDLREKLEQRRNFGLDGQDGCAYPGGNAKMSEFQAAMGICNLRHLAAEIAKRKAAAEAYRSRLSGVKGIRLCPEQEGISSNYAYFPVVFDGYKYSRDEVFARLKARDIIARKYFYPLTSCFDSCAGLPTAGAGRTPIAENIAGKILTLPMYADLTVADVNKICDIILE